MYSSNLSIPLLNLHQLILNLIHMSTILYSKCLYTSTDSWIYIWLKLYIRTTELPPCAKTFSPIHLYRQLNLKRIKEKLSKQIELLVNHTGERGSLLKRLLKILFYEFLLVKENKLSTSSGSEVWEDKN